MSFISGQAAPQGYNRDVARLVKHYGDSDAYTDGVNVSSSIAFFTTDMDSLGAGASFNFGSGATVPAWVTMLDVSASAGVLANVIGPVCTITAAENAQIRVTVDGVAHIFNFPSTPISGNRPCLLSGGHLFDTADVAALRQFLSAKDISAAAGGSTLSADNDLILSRMAAALNQGVRFLQSLKVEFQFTDAASVVGGGIADFYGGVHYHLDD